MKTYELRQTYYDGRKNVGPKYKQEKRARDMGAIQAKNQLVQRVDILVREYGEGDQAGDYGESVILIIDRTYRDCEFCDEKNTKCINVTDGTTKAMCFLHGPTTQAYRDVILGDLRARIMREKNNKFSLSVWKRSEKNPKYWREGYLKGLKHGLAELTVMRKASEYLGKPGAIRF